MLITLVALFLLTDARRSFGVDALLASRPDAASDRSIARLLRWSV